MYDTWKSPFVSDYVVGLRDLPLSNNLNGLDFPTSSKAISANKSEFATLSNLRMRKRNAHIFERAHNDLYVEPPWTSARLFEVEQFLEPIWDPCAGTGTIPRAALAAGLTCCASDISDGRDFLLEPALTSPPFSVVTNPPYNIAHAIVERALELRAAKVAFLFPIARTNAAWRWLQPLPLARLYLLTPRPSVPPHTAKVVGGGRVDFCWLVLDQRHRGAPTLGWLHRDGTPARFQRGRAGPKRKAARAATILELQS